MPVKSCVCTLLFSGPVKSPPTAGEEKSGDRCNPVKGFSQREVQKELVYPRGVFQEIREKILEIIVFLGLGPPC